MVVTTGTRTTRSLPLLVVALLLIVLALTFFYRTFLRPTSDILDALELVELLHNRNYAALNLTIGKAQGAYERGEGRDTVVDLAFLALANSDPQHEVLMDEWVSKFPESYVPYAARGRYYSELGWSVRGDKLARDTTAEQFEGMRHYHEKALSDLTRAIELNSKLTTAYSSIISDATGRSAGDLKDATLQRALAIDPASYVVRKSYLYSITPRWGGSFEEMDAFLKDTERYAEENPALKPLGGISEYVKGLRLQERGEYQKAVEHFTKALEHGEKPWYYHQRGIGYYWLELRDKAFDDFNRALALWPYDTEALDMRSWVYQKREMFDKALEDLTVAATLRPYDKTILKHRGFLLAEMGRYAEATEDLKASLRYYNSDVTVLYWLGWYLNYKLQRYQEAADAFRALTELEPGKAGHWYELGAALSHLKNCDVVPALNTYMVRCEGSGDDCGDEKKQWARSMLQYVRDHRICLT